MSEIKRCTCWWHYEHEAVAAWDRRPPTKQEGGE